MTLTVKPEISLNTVVALAAVGLGIYAFYKVKNVASDAVDSVGDWWEGVDLNPFDSEGAIGKLTTSMSNNQSDSITFYDAARKALAAKGKNMDKYQVYSPKAGEKLPADSWKVTYKNKIYYFVPRGSLNFFGKIK